MKTVVLTLSKTEFEMIDGRLHHKVLKREEFETLAPGELPPRRLPGRRRIREIRQTIKKADWTDWLPRAVELLNQGMTYKAASEILNREGFVSRQGKTISEQYIVMKIRNERKKAGA